jgi:5'-AMP-activated protein kinase, catalytic alpha subunit
MAIEYLAANGISHRDIKPENILLDANKDIKLIDFGLGKPYSQGELIKTACGSPCYAAPEMVARKYYRGEQVDIWSSGITLFAMLCGYLPFDDEDISVLYSKILKGEFEVPSYLSSEATDLLRNILVTDPQRRITFAELKYQIFYPDLING